MSNSRILLIVALGVIACFAVPMILFAWIGGFTAGQTFTAFGIAGCLLALMMAAVAALRAFFRS